VHSVSNRLPNTYDEDDEWQSPTVQHSEPPYLLSSTEKRYKTVRFGVVVMCVVVMCVVVMCVVEWWVESSASYVV
jgi:hypothetical protein